MSNEPIAGRTAYFSHAMPLYWPEILNALRKDVSPKYEPRWDAAGPGGANILEESWNGAESDPRTELMAALQSWADQFRITEEWIFQTALDTLQGFSKHPSAPISVPHSLWHWIYIPQSHHPRFQPNFEKNLWYPPSIMTTHAAWQHRPEEWSTFKSRMMSQFIQELDRYRHVIEDRLGVRKDAYNLLRDAGWTVRYQKGESAIAISESEDLVDYADAEQAVYRAIEVFAKLIDLKLRKRGERLPSISKPR